ncbi:alpha/beta hydrolase [Streptomyces sp. ISL-86]|uniref:alpha/beta hydrolase n=1 Tax=Streptomyces sp. ISL-86 TaxID=2819187 RepID=UPI001BE9E5B7|nr:alpha/beta hydrolase [Streptomyces sp. ISL-86]MBT2457547.1 alpha/beta fold hydrolase [Streptomyces sp. ISL-86]
MRRIAPLLAAAGLLATTVPLLSATQAAAAPAEEYAKQKPSWHRCSTDQPASYECATIKVPLDYRRPRGRTIDLAISRIKSENPAKRHGVMLLNPGGPGGPGLDLPLMTAESMPKEVRDQYDLIGFDPRGVGASSPVSCGLTDAEQNSDRPYRPGTFPSDVAWARTVAEKCREKAGAVLPYITTRNTARDMDAIRTALGERKISYLGYSYGTYLGAVYTQMFPNKTDRFLLDSGVDPQRVWRGMIQVWATEAEPAFQRWTGWTAERAGEYQLGDTPKAVSETFWALVARADEDPIDFDGEKVTGDRIRTARGFFFYPEHAARLVKALKDAAEGRPAGSAPELKQFLQDSRQVAGRATGQVTGQVTSQVPESEPEPASASEPASDNGTAVFWSVLCGDTDAWPRDPGQYRREAARDKVAYPLYGDFASNIKPCAFWQRPIEAATPMKTRANVLTVQNEWDSQTPLLSGQGLHRALKGSRMVLAMGGEGHGVYLADPNSCANAPVNAYLTTGRLPAEDVTCRTAPGSAEQRRESPASPKPLPLPLPLPSGPGRF